MTVTSEESARQLLEVVPVVMREIRSQMRNRGSLDLTIPQFRTLAFINHNKGSSLYEVSEHMGLTPSSVSTLVDGLVERGMMTREEHPTDRRRVRLAVTSDGRAILETATRGTLTYLAKKLSNVTPSSREVVAKAMEILRMTFAGSVRS